MVFGVNQQMRDYRTNRTKNLDLVIATPGTAVRPAARPVTLEDLAVRWSVRLTETSSGSSPGCRRSSKGQPAWSLSRSRPRPA